MNRYNISLSCVTSKQFSFIIPLNLTGHPRRASWHHERQNSQNLLRLWELQQIQCSSELLDWKILPGIVQWQKSDNSVAAFAILGVNGEERWLNGPHGPWII